MAISFQGATLYKLTSTGKLQYWKIYTALNTIITRFGQEGGKEQETQDTIQSGKNLGKANATTPERQAYAEAKARWEGKLKKGYVKSREDALASKKDSCIQGGEDVMLAHVFDDHKSKIHYPAVISTKFDGVRCVAIVAAGIASLWTRTRKPITSMPHIVKALEQTFATNDITLDGELYNHKYKNNFNTLLSYIRSESPVVGHEEVEYHVFDCVLPNPASAFYTRYQHLHQANFKAPIYLVPQYSVRAEADVYAKVKEFIAQGYEGGMVRNINAPYEHKRSYHIQKVKETQDAEFDIVGVQEGRGKLQGHVGSFICQTKSGIRFNVKLEGSLADLKILFEDDSTWENKKLTVRFQNYTPDGVPRFPIGVTVRDYE